MSCHQPDLPMSWRRRAFNAADTKKYGQAGDEVQDEKGVGQDGPVQSRAGNAGDEEQKDRVEYAEDGVVTQPQCSDAKPKLLAGRAAGKGKLPFPENYSGVF